MHSDRLYTTIIWRNNSTLNYDTVTITRRNNSTPDYLILQYEDINTNGQNLGDFVFKPGLQSQFLSCTGQVYWLI